MPAKHPIAPPAKYITPAAVGFADENGDLTLVTAATPLPVGGAAPFAIPAPLTGATALPLVAGPFAPAPGRPVHLQLGGSWTGEVRLQRSVDGGVTRADLTAGGLPWGRFTGNANEPVWHEGESGATLWLDLAPTSGTVTFRVSQ